MAYMNQDKKAKTAAKMKPVLKKYGLKGSISVHNHSSITLTIKSGPIDFGGDHVQVNPYWLDSNYKGVALKALQEIKQAILAADWYDIYGAQGIVRFPDVPVQIDQAERVAFVEVILPDQTGAGTLTPFEQAFRDSGVPYTVHQVAPNLLVIIPLAPVDPAVLGDGLGYQF